MRRVKHCLDPDCPTRRESGRAAEYRGHVERCADCGGELADGPEPPNAVAAHERESVAEFGETAIVAVIFDPLEAEIAKDLLDGARIPHLIAGENASTMFGGVIGRRILAPVSRVDEARRLLRAEGLRGAGGPAKGESASEQRFEPAAAETERSSIAPLLLFIGGLILLAVLELLRAYR